MAADLAAIQRTAPWAILVYTNNDTSPAIPTVDEYSAMAGTAPTGARTGNGDVTFTWDASYNDPYSRPADVHLIGAKVTVLGTTSAFGVASFSDPDTNGKDERMQVVIFDDAGVAVSDAVVAVAVYSGTT